MRQTRCPAVFSLACHALKPPPAPPKARQTRVVAALKKSGLVQRAGVMTSVVESGLQWDAPNWYAAAGPAPKDSPHPLLPLLRIRSWAPIQDLIVLGLERTRLEEASTLAESIAIRWLVRLRGVPGAMLSPPPPLLPCTSPCQPQLSNYLGWKRSNLFEMHEKYHGTEAGERGAGGEYTPQVRRPPRARPLREPPP